MRFEEICEKLKKAGIDAPKHEAALLLEKFCGVSPSALPLIGDRDFSDEKLSAAVSRRAERYPLQYILGEWNFYGEKYLVDESCLIPRSDTEILVETAINKLPKNAVFADLCTGSGCIAISILAHRKDCRAFAFEISQKALGLAKKNSELNGVAERFFPMEADVLNPIIANTAFDAIISNPPYIRTGVLPSLSEEVKKEPIIALDGGEDGLIFYRAILQKHTSLLKKDGFIAFEIGYDQGEELKGLATQHGFECEIIKDYGGNDRVALLTKSIQ
ncbi:MAG: peptide chain release factor N(5)-glutamine methyltransferase [Clostridia bacterium]|nr:peptide chain release factor N(5)-glutamine methyltransferase [Clostridia bacterium]